MTVFIAGGSKSGKSMEAQRIARELAGQERLFYLATMEPRDLEDSARISRHVKQREGWGFETLECPRNICQAIEAAGAKGVFLLDSVTALLSNEMYPEGRINFYAAEKIARELEALSKNAAGLVVVSDNIYCDCGGYEKFTEEFRRGLAMIERRLAGSFDRVLELSINQAVELKRDIEIVGEDKVMELIIGGAYQGKTEYAKKQFGLSESDICVCKSGLGPDLSKRCLSHLENLADYCMDSGESGRSLLEIWMEQHHDGVLICNDIFCGVVPVDSRVRAWREAAGQLLGFAAERAGAVTRLCCGLPQKLK